MRAAQVHNADAEAHIGPPVMRSPAHGRALPDHIVGGVPLMLPRGVWKLPREEVVQSTWWLAVLGLGVNAVAVHHILRHEVGVVDMPRA